MSDLDVLGVLCGTDKSSSIFPGWDYLRHYDDLFCRWRKSQINILEIGVLGGSSLHMWKQYFDKASIIGLDIDPDVSRFADERITIKIGSQDDKDFLEGIVQEFPPTIVIDDGSHLAHHMVASFEALFPALAPDGVYVFEDMAFHFEDGGGHWKGAKEHQGLAAEHMYDYLNKFMRARAANQRRPEGSNGFLRYAFEHIDSVVVFGGGIAVRKRAAVDVASDSALFDKKYKKQANPAAAAARYAEFLLKHDGDLGRAKTLLDDALKRAPKDETALMCQVELSIRQGRLDDAASASAALMASNLQGKAYKLLCRSWRRLSMIERKKGRPDVELAALRTLAKLDPNDSSTREHIARLEKGTAGADSTVG